MIRCTGKVRERNVPDYAHRNKVIHRDLKPANILVTDDGRAKITDFGIAKVLAREGVARTIGIMGTPSYMSPEQVKGGDIDARTDIFSLGIMIFTMLTGTKPFSGNTVAVMFKIVYEEPQLPSSLNPQLTPAHDYLIKKCLEKDRNQRYSSARELLNDLDDLQHGRPLRSQAVAPAPVPPSPAPAPHPERTLTLPIPGARKTDTPAAGAAHAVTPRRLRAWLRSRRGHRRRGPFPRLPHRRRSRRHRPSPSSPRPSSRCRLRMHGLFWGKRCRCVCRTFLPYRRRRRHRQPRTTRAADSARLFSNGKYASDGEAGPFRRIAPDAGAARRGTRATGSA